MDALKAAFDVWTHLAEPWHIYFSRYFGVEKCEGPEAFQESMSTSRPNCRRAPGFEDFAGDRARGIEPGSPAGSFLYHALASPSVQPPELKDGEFPTEAQLESIENYVFAQARIALRDLPQLAQGRALGIAVFTKQYRNINETTHRKHADLVFSRTGVARVGNEGKRWNGRLRCYDSCTPGEKGMPVLPGRYSAWIAMKVTGNSGAFVPGRFQAGDDGLSFWVPLHKLFNGDDCLEDIPVQLRLRHYHQNEKLRRVHRAIQYLGYGSGHSEPEISDAPFVETDLLDCFQDDGDSVLVIPKDQIAAEVTASGEGGNQPVTVRVPPNVRDQDSSFHIIPRPKRWAPEFVYVRDAIIDGARKDLNLRIDVSAFVRRGGFEAVHYRDFTGDGWIRADCPVLALTVPLSLPAYSILAPPDMVPNVKQADLMDWFNNSAPAEIKTNLWVGSSPVPLCDTRDAANIKLPMSGFVVGDVGIAALAGLASSPFVGAQPVTQLPGDVVFRTTSLPDDASGIFAPGSEIGEDLTDQPANEDGSTDPAASFFSNYGMGSPFLEDTKLCAAQSAFWPGTTPDTSRVYEPHSQPSVTPLTDEEIPWDGSPLPQLLDGRKVRHLSRANTDYVRNDTFNFGLLAKLNLSEYIERTLTMSRVYQALGANTLFDRSQWVVLSFRSVSDAKGETDLPASNPFAESAPLYCFAMYRHNGQIPDQPDPNEVPTFLVSFDEKILAYANSTHVLLERNGSWEQFQF